jgi:hypothetical protein
MNLDCFLICDDIRNEVGGKQTLVGVYGEGINFNVPANQAGKWPKAMRLGIYIRLSFDSDAEKETATRMKMEYTINGKTTSIIDAPNPPRFPTNFKGMNIAVVMNQCIITGPGELQLKLFVYGKDSNVMATYEKPITVNETIMPPVPLR